MLCRCERFEIFTAWYHFLLLESSGESGGRREHHLNMDCASRVAPSMTALSWNIVVGVERSPGFQPVLTFGEFDVVPCDDLLQGEVLCHSISAICGFTDGLERPWGIYHRFYSRGAGTCNRPNLGGLCYGRVGTLRLYPLPKCPPLQSVLLGPVHSQSAPLLSYPSARGSSELSDSRQCLFARSSIRSEERH